MSYTIQGNTGAWEVIIGLEVHAQVISKSKLFSGASTAFGAEPNAQVSFVDSAQPGMLPVVNKECLAQAVRTGLGLKAKINAYCVFDRKNYFYADLPQGYQISQLYHPIVGEGEIEIDLEGNKTRKVGIERLHLEQDAGKSIHDLDPKRSFIDLNRCGVALMEIVSRPDLRSPEEAGAYLRKLRTIFRYLGTCDGNMEEGSMRADVNVSVRKTGEPLGTRTETKNVNSVRFVMQAIESEAKRQVALIESGGEVVQETRLWDTSKGATRPMRSKEFAHDYRYFPCPDLLPVQLEEAFIESIRLSLPELPDVKKARFIQDYGLPAYDAGVLVAERETADFYEAVVKAAGDAKLAANWVMGDFFAALNKAGIPLEKSPIRAQQLGGLLVLIKDNTISGRIAKDVFEQMWDSGKEAATIVDEKGLRQISDTGALEAIIDKIISDNPAQVEKLAQNPKLLGWFVGQTMKATGGKANPALVNTLLNSKLGQNT